MRNMLLFKRSLLPAFFFILSFSSIAQVTEEWVARYNGPASQSDVAVDLEVDAAGNVYVTGSSTGVGTFADYATIKYNAAGVQQWVARYNGPGNFFDEVMDLAIDDEGNVYVTGASDGTTGTDYATIKYNNDGVLQWVARYNGPNDSTDVATALAVDDGGNVYVTGRSGGIGTGLDYATIKYNSAGVLQWVTRYNGPGDSTDRANAIVIDDDFVYVTGSSVGDGTSFDYATIKHNITTGEIIWVSRFNGAGNDRDEANSLTVDDAGNVYVTGTIISGFIPEDPFPLELFDWATIKYNSVGAVQWVSMHDEGGDDFAVSVLLDNMGNVIVTGSISNSPPRLEEPDLDYGTIKYNALTGAEIWVSKYGPPEGVDFNAWRGADQAIDSAGNVYVTGQTGQGTYGTIKWDTNGQLQWAVTYTNGISDAANAITLDASGNVYVTGGSQGIGTGADFATIKYAQLQIVCGSKGNKVLVCHNGKTKCIDSAAVQSHLNHGDQLGACAPTTITAREGQHAGSNAIPANFRVNVIPNPASTTTKLFYELPADGRVSIAIYDILGRQITTLVNANKPAGLHNTECNVTTIQNGMYYYRILVKTAKTNWSQTGKINVVK